MVAVIEMYERHFKMYGVPKARLDQKRTFASAAKTELLAHAHFLCDGVKEFARNPEKFGKANRHLAAIQMLLSFAGRYTLEDLMNHNRP